MTLSPERYNVTRVNDLHMYETLRLQEIYNRLNVHIVEFSAYSMQGYESVKTSNVASKLPKITIIPILSGLSHIICNRMEENWNTIAYKSNFCD